MAVDESAYEMEMEIRLARSALISLNKKRQYILAQPVMSKIKHSYDILRHHLSSLRGKRKKEYHPRKKRILRDNYNIYRIIREFYWDPLILVSHGKERKGIKNNKGGKLIFSIYVGWMWHEKVFFPFYEEPHSRDYSDYLILHAERIKINIKNVDLYEAKLFKIKDGEVKEGYISITKNTPKKEAFIRLGAIDAGNAAQRSVSRQITELLKGPDNEQDT